MEKSKEDDSSKEMDTWKYGYGHCESVKEGHLMLVMEFAKAMALEEAKPTTQNNSSTQMDVTTTIHTGTQTDATTTFIVNIQMTPPTPIIANASIQTTTSTNKMAMQTESTPQPTPQIRITHTEPPAVAMSQLQVMMNIAPIDVESQMRPTRPSYHCCTNTIM
jgi:hypothetical protein